MEHSKVKENQQKVLREAQLKQELKQVEQDNKEAELVEIKKEAKRQTNARKMKDGIDLQ